MAARPKRTQAAPPTTASAPAPHEAPKGVRIRMYRLGVGDCFLVTLPKADGTAFNMLIDCGIHMAEENGRDRIRKAVADIVARAPKLDVVVGTHEHWDHLSGFLHGQDLFPRGCADTIWCSWAEDETDSFAKSLIGNRDKAVEAMWGAVRRLKLDGAYAGVAEGGRDWSGILGFFGDTPGTGVKAKQAAEALRGMAIDPSKIVYHTPGAPPIDSVSDDWRIFVLGPPRDKTALFHMDPAKGSKEAYPLSAATLAAAAMATDSLAASVSAEDDPPFDDDVLIDLQATHTLPFFATHYWADKTDIPLPDDPDTRTEAPDQDWRRIGQAWLDGAEALALKLDKITNNTSLVLALELGPKEAKDNPVVLFAADAQIGNWQSWQSVVWKNYNGRKVTGPDLLRRTVIYKVGHHASQNATLMENGLETMSGLKLALVPTSAEMAGKVGWGTLPWPNLLTRLDDLTKQHVLRSDASGAVAVTATPGFTIEASDLCFDIVFTPG